MGVSRLSQNVVDFTVVQPNCEAEDGALKKADGSSVAPAPVAEPVPAASSSQQQLA